MNSIIAVRQLNRNIQKAKLRGEESLAVLTAVMETSPFFIFQVFLTVLYSLIIALPYVGEKQRIPGVKTPLPESQGIYSRERASIKPSVGHYDSVGLVKATPFFS